MHCEHVLERLDALADGELSRLAVWRVTHHLARCPSCAAEWEAVQRIGAQAREWRNVTAPSGLRERIAASLAAAPGLSSSEKESLAMKRRTYLLRLNAAGAGIVGILAVLAFLVIGQPGRPTIAFADVQAALQSVNTWHLRGWKMQEGRRVPWEIWGRRRPFFYREQLGDTLIFDDGTQRIQVYPALNSVRRDEGFVLRTASQHGWQDKDWSFTTQFRNLSPYGKPWKETRDTLVFNLGSAGMEGPETLSDNLYTVDRRTMLPVQLEVRRVRGSPLRQTAEYLRAEYDIPLPAFVTTPPQPKGLRYVDALSAPSDINLPTENMASKNGLAAQITPVAMDAKGLIVARVRVWLGNLPLSDGGSLYYDVQVPSGYLSHQTSQEVAQDDDGRIYVRLEDRFTVKREFLVFAPLEPLPPGAPLPRALTINLGISANTTTPVSGVRMTQGNLLLHEDLAWTVPLPDTAAPIDINAYRDPHVIAEEAPLESDIASARWLHYIRKNDYRRAAEWLEKSVAACDPASNIAQMRRLDLALEYERIGDTRRAAALYREVIADSNRYPHTWMYYRKRAEASLRLMAQRRK